MTPTNKLKPCPFCGEEAEILGRSPQLYVQCTGDCGLQLPAGEHTFFTSEEIARRRWNNRTANACHDCRAAIERCWKEFNDERKALFSAIELLDKWTAKRSHTDNALFHETIRFLHYEEDRKK